MTGLRRRVAILVSGIAAVLALIAPASAGAATLTVNAAADTSDGVCATSALGCSLRDALASANSADGIDTVDFAPGLPTIDLNSAVSVYDTVNIAGPGADKLTVQRSYGAATSFPVFSVSDPTKSLAISGVTITNGRGTGVFGHGGGIYFAGDTLTLDRVRVTGNEVISQTAIVNGNAFADGGGVSVYTGHLNMSNSTIDNNYVRAFPNGTGTALASGGGVSVEIGNSATITNSTIAGNTAGDGGAGGSPGNGGGIANNGTLTLTNSTLDLNKADDFGGGLDNFEVGVPAAATLNAVTLSENEANVDGDGYGAGGGTQSGSGAPSGITVQNTLYAYNRSHQVGGDPIFDQCYGFPHISHGYNLRASLESGCTGFVVPGDITASLGIAIALADNGGPTQTRALEGASLAIDAGNPAAPGSGGDACPATDQRGFFRGFSAGRCDIGAYEVGALEQLPAAPASPPAAVSLATARKSCKKKSRSASAAKKKKCKKKRKK
jgi:CSLREA domain-containing protein